MENNFSTHDYTKMEEAREVHVHVTKIEDKNARIENDSWKGKGCMVKYGTETTRNGNEIKIIDIGIETQLLTQPEMNRRIDVDSTSKWTAETLSKTCRIWPSIRRHFVHEIDVNSSSILAVDSTSNLASIHSISTLILVVKLYISNTWVPPIIATSPIFGTVRNSVQYTSQIDCVQTRNSTSHSGDEMGSLITNLLVKK